MFLTNFSLSLHCKQIKAELRYLEEVVRLPFLSSTPLLLVIFFIKFYWLKFKHFVYFGFFVIFLLFIMFWTSDYTVPTYYIYYIITGIYLGRLQSTSSFRVLFFPFFAHPFVYPHKLNHYRVPTQYSSRFIISLLYQHLESISSLT